MPPKLALLEIVLAGDVVRSAAFMLFLSHDLNPLSHSLLLARSYYHPTRFQQRPCCAKKNAGQTVRPFSFAVAIADLVVANLDHHRGQGARPGMPLDRVIDLVPRRVGLVDADRKGRVGLEVANKKIGQAAVLAD